MGLLAGLVAVAFRHALAAAEDSRGQLLETLRAYPRWGWAVLPVLGLLTGSIVGWITTRFAPAASGSGIPHLKGVLLHLRTLRWKSLLPVKFIGGVLGIGAGLSLGREGPTVQMGAAVAQGVAEFLKVSIADLPQLLSAGAGAGLAAAFNAPLAGLVFVVEELHRELSSRTAAGALLAAVCATVVTQALAGDTPSFDVRDLQALPLTGLPLAILVGVLGGVGGVAFNRALLAGQRVALQQRAAPAWLLPGIAGLIVGAVAWGLPESVGGGHALGERLLAGALHLAPAAALGLLAAKFALTVICYASGAPGGIFAPMLLLGALLGVMLAGIAAPLAPGGAAPATTLAVLGMTAFFVGSVRAPLTGIVLISEMTGGYLLLFPSCIAALTAYLSAEALREEPIYDALLQADLARRGHGAAQAAPRTVYIGIQSGAAIAGRTIAEAGLPQNCLIIAIDRNGEAVLPTARTLLAPGDHISVLVPGDTPGAAIEIVHLCTGL